MIFKDIYILSGKFKSQKEAEDAFNKNLLSFVSNCDGMMFWRFKPELNYYKDFESGGTIFEKYGRLVVSKNIISELPEGFFK